MTRLALTDDVCIHAGSLGPHYHPYQACPGRVQLGFAENTLKYLDTDPTVRDRRCSCKRSETDA